MTDHKVLVFGSFTENEIKSLQSQPTVNELDIHFGSIDSATLRSVGIFSTKQTEHEDSKGFHPSKLVDRDHDVKFASQIPATMVDKNGSIHDLHSTHCSDGVEELKAHNVEVSALSVPGDVCDQPFQSSSINHSTSGVTVSSNPLADELLNDSSKVLNLGDSKEKNICKASTSQVASVKNILPRGLINLGNLCFLNATLQALLSCSSFVQLLQELRTRNIPQIGYPTLHAFVEFFSEFGVFPDSSTKQKQTVILETGRPFRPVMFESILKTFSPDVPDSFSGRPRQEDAQEFLSFVMHQMHDELLKLEGQTPNGFGGKKISLVSSMNDEDDDDNWETVGPRNKSAITRTQSFIPSQLSMIFGGQLRSVVKARGNKASATIQPFLLLHLNISPDPVFTIEHALHIFSAAETLEGYRAASRKAEVVGASKSVKIQQLPEIMILHLMRFSYGSQGSTKLHKPVHFPLELVLGRELLVSTSSEGRRFELVATITHHGSDPSKGHYTADARHFTTGKWLRYNDASVTPIPTSKVLHDEAYILFYKQL